MECDTIKKSEHTQRICNITLEKAASVGKQTLPSILPHDTRNKNKVRDFFFSVESMPVLRKISKYKRATTS